MATGTVMLIAILMASIAMGILAMNSLNSGRDIRYALFHSMMDLVHNNLYVFGQNDAAWRATLEYNYNQGGKFNCIKTNTNCIIYSAPNVQYVEDIVLRYPTNSPPSNSPYGTTFYNGSRIAGETNRDGFRLDGSVCDYSQAPTPVISDGCILNVRVQWRPFCITDCKIGPNKIIFELTYNTPTVDENGNSIGHRNFFLPAYPQGQSGPIPIYNPYR